MPQTIVLDDETARLLKILTDEEGITPEAYVAKVVKKDDSNRHSSWSRKQQRFIRVKCYLKGCKETYEQPNSDRAD